MAEEMPAQAGGPWPVPMGMPLYVTVERAALLAGVPYERMKAYASAAVDPIPHIAVGRAKKLIRTAAIPAYMESREER